MASYKDLTTKNIVNPLSDSAESTLATMQADMDAALKGTRDTSVNIDTHLNNEPKDNKLDEAQISRVIEMAWEDRTPFGAIEHSYGLTEPDVIKLMRQELKPSSFRLWRQRVSNRATKHQAKRTFEVGRAYCKTQYKPR